MTSSFETLISTYLHTQVGISQQFLSQELVAHLIQNITELKAQKLLLMGGTGHDKEVVMNRHSRSDEMYWLDRSHDNKHENDFFERVEDFIAYLNRTCFTGIRSYEFHYSWYAPGSFYRAHLDQFNDTTSRQFTLITYLNANWKESDGGYLKIQQESGDQKISPTLGKTVFFKSSELVHEVELNHAPRLSVCGWLKRN